MKTIAVSGSVGTGKTKTARAFAKEKGYKYLDVKKFIEKQGLKGKYDRKRQTYEVDIKKLNKALTDFIDEFEVKQAIKNKDKDFKGKKYKGLVIDSHLSHYLPKEYVDLCMITKCSDLRELEKRLKKRKYSKKKIDENIECEIMQVCLQEAKEAGHKIKMIETSSEKKKKRKRNKK